MSVARAAGNRPLDTGGAIAGMGSGADKAAGFIRARLPLVAPPIVPEIRLHLAQPASGVSGLAAASAGGPPYWAYCWAGGLALARYMLDRPASVAGLRVLDLGTGTGLVAIAAALAGAREVTAADIDSHAIAATALNAQANGVDIKTFRGDLTRGTPPVADLIVVGDLFYEYRLAKKVTAFLDRCAALGIGSLVGDPGRRHLPLSRLRPLAHYDVPDFGDGKGPARRSTVYSFVPSSAGFSAGDLRAG
jgi:predicted nicotinamide N-methyase